CAEGHESLRLWRRQRDPRPRGCGRQSREGCDPRSRVEALKRPRKGGAYIRVNAFTTDFCYGDAVAVVGPGLDGIVLPMVESREQIVAFDWLVGALERERGLPPGAIDIIPIIETGKGIANARAIAAAGTRVKRM